MGKIRSSEQFAAGAQRLSQIAQAEAYVASRFFPPLPREYGRLAVAAVEEVNGGDPFSIVSIPADIEIVPKGAELVGQFYEITALRLVEVLRLTHLIADDEWNEDDDV